MTQAQAQLTKHRTQAEGVINDADDLADRSGRPFRPASILAIWTPDGVGRWSLTFVCVTGKAIRRDGTLGTSDRFCLFEPQPHSRIQFGPPLATAPEWVRQFIQKWQPTRMGV